MRWPGAGDELWVVNTRFSCLCTLDRTASFTPRWRPPFVSVLEPTDRCHLNGLGMVDGRPRYVTALGRTDAPGGWRPEKASGGIVMDIASGEGDGQGPFDAALAALVRGRLWVCESGAGTLGYRRSHRALRGDRFDTGVHADWISRATWHSSGCRK